MELAILRLRLSLLLFDAECARLVLLRLLLAVYRVLWDD